MINTDNETIDSLKKERNSFKKKLEVEIEKNQLAEIDIEKERRIWSQYIA
jgi:hypothetical protein